MKLRIVAVGRIRERFFREAADHYADRVRRYAPLDVVEIDPRKAGRRIAAAVRAAVPDRAIVVALDPAGVQLGSIAFAERIASWRRSGRPALAFLLGGPDGLPSEVLADASFRLSFGPATLPHRLARVVLMEQIYRAMTILRGEPYDRS